MRISGTTEAHRARFRARGIWLLVISVVVPALILAVLWLNWSTQGDSAASDGDNDGTSDVAVIIVALIGAVPSTITAVTGLVLVLRNRPAPPPAEPPEDSDSDHQPT